MSGVIDKKGGEEGLGRGGGLVLLRNLSRLLSVKCWPVFAALWACEAKCKVALFALRVFVLSFLLFVIHVFLCVPVSCKIPKHRLIYIAATFSCAQRKI